MELEILNEKHHGLRAQGEIKMTGKLYGIGVGPGDPELLTLKAVRLIKECDKIVVPGEDYKTSVAYKIALDAVPELAQKEVHGIAMPMTKDKDILEENYGAAAAVITGWLDEGKDVGILNLGDVTVYSTCLYIHKLVKAAGYHTELVNGIPSFCAVAARLDMGLVERSQQLHVLPASYQIEEGLKLPGTKVLMKSGKQIGKVKKLIKEMGMNAVMIENCGMEEEKIYRTTDEIDENAGYYSLMIVKEQEE